MKTKNKNDQINVSHCFEISAYIAEEEIEVAFKVQNTNMMHHKIC